MSKKCLYQERKVAQNFVEYSPLSIGQRPITLRVYVQQQQVIFHMPVATLE